MLPSYRSRPSVRAWATASVRLDGAERARMWLTCFLTVSSAATGSLAICWFGVPRPATPALQLPARRRLGRGLGRSRCPQARGRAGTQPVCNSPFIVAGTKAARASGHSAGRCRDRRWRRRVTGQTATMTAGIQPTAMMGAQLCCRRASTTELTATNTAASAAMAYSHRVHGLMSNIPSVECRCHDGPACCGRLSSARCLPSPLGRSPGHRRAGCGDGGHGLSFRARRLGGAVTRVVARLSPVHWPVRFGSAHHERVGARSSGR